MKKFTALMLMAALVLCTLTGCVASNSSTIGDIARPEVSVKVGETELTATVESTEVETAEDGSVIDNNIYNAVEKDAVIAIAAKTGTAKSIAYRINNGDLTVVNGASAEITVAADLDKLETYIIGSDGIASNWVTYFFEAA